MRMPLSKPISSFQNWNDTKKTVLPGKFYLSRGALSLSRDLLGKVLVTEIDGHTSSGIIIETEAYCGVADRASHAYANRCTERTKVMFGPGGRAYVYMCYGIHYLFNVVCLDEGIPHAVLIRNIVPLEGLEIIKKRRFAGGKSNRPLTSGPGTVSQALGINLDHNGIELKGPEIRIEDRSIEIDDDHTIIGPRIGVSYAGPDADLPYRFRIKKAE